MIPIEYELDKYTRLEERFLRLRRRKTPSPLDVFVEERLPPSLRTTLEDGFSKGLLLARGRGTEVVEKTFDKTLLQQQYRDRRHTLAVTQNRADLLPFVHSAQRTRTLLSSSSYIKGISLGLLGVGLPDIPLFILVVLRGIYEIALHYGFSYDSEEEGYYIFTLLETALSRGEEVDHCHGRIQVFLDTRTIPLGDSLEEAGRRVAQKLSLELLSSKALQGVLVVGAIGGVMDGYTVGRVLELVSLECHIRFLRKLKAQGRPVTSIKELTSP